MTKRYLADALTEYVETVVIDPLGAPTLEQVTEAKDTPARRAFNAVVVALVLTLAALVIWATGVYVGAMKPEVWNHVPGVVEPSGERAEPEESAR